MVAVYRGTTFLNVYQTAPNHILQVSERSCFKDLSMAVCLQVFGAYLLAGYMLYTPSTFHASKTESKHTGSGVDTLHCTNP